MRAVHRPGLGLLSYLALTACDAVELRFGERSVGGQRPEDDANLVRLCQEPDDEETPVAPARDAATPAFDIGASCQGPATCDGAFAKCTLVDGAAGAPFEAACVQSTGQREIGDCCERRNHGDDDCAPGGWCTPLGIGTVEEGPMACRELCWGADGCGPQERCLALGESAGLCLSPCRIFGDDCVASGVRCVAGSTLAGNYFGYCARYGSGVSDDACGSDADCAPAFVCEQDSATCRQMCDDDHPCPEPERCLPLGLGDPESPRICRP